LWKSTRTKGGGQAFVRHVVMRGTDAAGGEHKAWGGGVDSQQCMLTSAPAAEAVGLHGLLHQPGVRSTHWCFQQACRPVGIHLPWPNHGAHAPLPPGPCQHAADPPSGPTRCRRLLAASMISCRLSGMYSTRSRSTPRLRRGSNLRPAADGACAPRLGTCSQRCGAVALWHAGEGRGARTCTAA